MVVKSKKKSLSKQSGNRKRVASKKSTSEQSNPKRVAEKETVSQKKQKAVSKSVARGKPSQPRGKIQKVDIEKFLKQFDAELEQKNFQKAQDMLNRLGGLKKWQYLNLQSLIKYKTGDVNTSEDLMRQALREPDCNVVVNRNLGGLLINQGRMREGLPFCQKAYEEMKDLKSAQLYLNSLLDLGRAEEVLKVSNDILKDNPDDKTILVSRASALRSVQRVDEADKELDRLIEKFPAEPVIRRIKADLLGDKSTREALPFYEKALQLSVDNKGVPDPAIQWNMSLHLLRARDMERGWECWEQGFHPIVGTMGRNLPKRITTMPRADNGKKIDRNKWTLICAEQGIGDQILFMHSMNEAIEEFGKVLYITEKRLYPIIKRSFPGMEVAAQGATYDWTRNSLKKNGYIPLGSIPRRHRKTTESYLANQTPFLRANKDHYDKYKAHLRKLANGRPIIGISWKGGFWQIQRKTKELELSNWDPIFERNALYVNLQYGDITEDLSYLRAKNRTLVTFKDLDFKVHIDEWVAIAGACDGIISVSTALVHFAGAIGQKVAVVMPGEQGPWHLGLDDTKSMAYKNVRIFRPTQKESLPALVDRVSKLIV